MNLTHEEFAIMESYNGSDVQFKQKAGRLDRLGVDNNDIITFIVVKNTQGEKWFNNSVTFDEDDEVRIVKSIKEFKEALVELKWLIMREQFCSYEIALKLKELGFDEPCIAYYFIEKQ